MEYSIFRFTLNMHNHRSQASVSAFCGDTAIRLCFTLADGSNVYRIEDGCVAILSGTKADGSTLWNRCAIENNTIIYDFTEQTANCVGMAKCEITLYGADGKVITAPKFTIVVDEREVSGNDVNISESEQTAIDVIMEAAAIINSGALNFDNELSSTSEKAVKNKVVTNAINELSERATASETEIKKIKEDFVYTVDSELSETSENPVQNKVVAAKLRELDERSPAEITVDDKLDGESENPVQNKVIKNAIENLRSYKEHTVYPTDEQRANRDMRGWYRIAETTNSGYWSNIFHVQAQVLRSASTSDAIFTAERMSYQSDPSIGILSFASQRGQYDAIDKLRVVYLKNDSTQKAYLEVHINRNATPADAWDGTGTSTGYKFISETHFKGQYNWSLIEPILVSSEIEDGWTAYEKSPLESAWSQVTASVDDINEFFKDGVPNAGSSISVDSELSDTSANPVQNKVITSKFSEVEGNFQYYKSFIDTLIFNGGTYPTLNVCFDDNICDFFAVESNSEVEYLTNYALMYKFKCECNEYDIDTYVRDDLNLPESFWKNIAFDITFIPDSLGATKGRIDSIEVTKNNTDYQIVNISASRGNVSFVRGEFLTIFKFVSILELEVITPDDSTQQGTASICYYHDCGDNYSLSGSTITVAKNSFTEQFVPSATYDLRTQSLDRQLLAFAEEAEARREAAKANEEET